MAKLLGSRLKANSKESVNQSKMTVAFRPLVRVLQGSNGFEAVVRILVANVLVLGLNVGTGILTARLLGPAGRGEQAAMIMWPQFLAFLLALGLPSALLYNLKRRPDESDELVGAALLIGGFIGIVAILAGVLVIPLWLKQYPIDVVRFAQFAMVFAPLNLLGMVCNSAMQARYDFTLYNRTNYLPPLLTLLLLVLLATTHHLTPFSSASAYLLGGLPVSLWSVSWIWRRYRPTLRAFAVARNHLLSYSLRSWGVNVLGTLSWQLDRVLVVGFLEPIAMGLYVAAFSLSRVLDAFQSAVVSVLFPKASGRSQEEAVALTGRAARASTTVSALAAVGLILLGPQVLGLLYSKDFTAATAVFRLLVAEAVLAGLARILSQAFMALDRPGVVTMLQGVGIGLSLPLLVWLVPRYGLEGAGIALLLSTSVRLIFTYACFPLVLKTSPPKLWIRPSEMLLIVQERFNDYGHKH